MCTYYGSHITAFPLYSHGLHNQAHSYSYFLQAIAISHPTRITISACRLGVECFGYRGASCNGWRPCAGSIYCKNRQYLFTDAGAASGEWIFSTFVAVLILDRGWKATGTTLTTLRMRLRVWSRRLFSTWGSTTSPRFVGVCNDFLRWVYSPLQYADHACWP